MPDFDIESERLGESGWSWSLPEINRATPSRDQLLDEMKLRLAACQSIDAVLFQLAPLNRDFIELLPESCQIIQRVGIGMDNIDHQAAAERAIVVNNTPGYCLEEVSLHAMSILLALHRGIFELHHNVSNGIWVDRPPRPIENLSRLTLGIVGMGRIGQWLCQRMVPLVNKVLFSDPNVDLSDFENQDPALLGKVARVDLDELLGQSDMVTLHCPLNESTEHLINAKSFEQMKNSAILVNTARGRVVDQAALIDALDAGEIAACGLDVFVPEVLPADSRLRNRSNVILTSHTAWYSEQSSPAARNMAIDGILKQFAD